ncbi:MAG: hypothetical protein NUV69_05060 [Candidatus Curtissbacteria bacterium]|nr:hypothetical protein [Candidatus Curtissbacteria bacterium]
MADFVVFLFAVFAAFYVPGNLVLRPLKLSFLESLVLSFSVGIVLWVFQGYIFGILDARQLTYLYLFASFLVWTFLQRKHFLKLQFRLPNFKVDILSLIIVIVGIVLNLSAVWFIGVRNEQGLYLCCRGVPDAIFHLSLTNELIKNVPPFEPGMVGVHVRNYHYFSNLAAAELSRVFNLDFIKVQFQFLSLILALLLGGSAFVLGELLGLGKSFSRWLAIFLYASGDILYVLLFLRGKGFNFDVTIIDDASKLLAGPPRAFSIVIFLAGLSLLVRFFRKKEMYAGILAAVVMGSLIGFKVYSGLFALAGFFGIGVYFLLRQNLRLTLVPIICLLISMAYFIPVNRSAGGLFFNGMWRFENFVQHKDLAISKLDYLRLERLQENRIFEVYLLEAFFVVLFFIFLFGTVNFGLLQTRSSFKLFPRELNIFLLSGMITSLIAGSFFYQKTGGANTVQFLISVFIIGAIYASLSLYYWTRRLPAVFKVILIALVLTLTVSRSLYEGMNNFLYVQSKKGYLVTSDELNAFSYLKNETPRDSVVLVESWMAEDEPFMYVSFLSDRPLFLSGAGVLRDHGQDTKSREGIVRVVFSSSDPLEIKNNLKGNSISYLYVEKNVYESRFQNLDFLQKVYFNDKSIVLKVI